MFLKKKNSCSFHVYTHQDKLRPGPHIQRIKVLVHLLYKEQHLKQYLGHILAENLSTVLNKSGKTGCLGLISHLISVVRFCSIKHRVGSSVVYSSHYVDALYIAPSLPCLTYSVFDELICR